MKRWIPLLFVSQAFATTIEITADLPTEREDGSPLAVEEIAGIMLYGDYCGTLKSLLLTEQAFINGKVLITDETDKPISECKTAYQLTTIDTNGLESAKTPPINLVQPKPPTNIEINVIVNQRLQVTTP